MQLSIPYPPPVGWNHSGNKLIYSTGEEIRIYDITSLKYTSIKKTNVSYPQFFTGDKELLYVREDTAGIKQIYRSNIDGSNEKQITNMDSNSLSNARLSPDGSFVLYTWPGASISMIYTIELRSGKTYGIPGGLRERTIILYGPPIQPR